jgi:hypothetical protein
MNQETTQRMAIGYKANSGTVCGVTMDEVTVARVLPFALSVFSSTLFKNS